MNSIRFKPFFLPPLLHAAAFGFALAIGWRMRIRWDYYQILQEDALRERLCESLWHMHSQPPALNLILGLALKLEASSGIAALTTLLAFNYLMGLTAVLCLTRLCYLLIPSRRAALICACLIALHPALQNEQFRWYYPIHEAALLSGIALSLYRVIDAPSVRRYALLCLLCAALTYWRALFHFVWSVLVAGWALGYLLRSGRAGPRRGAYAGVFLIFLTVLAAWPAKNQAVFGRFVYSSWMWFNMAQGLGLSPMEHPDKPIPEEFEGIQVLSVEFKSPGVYNWNHYDFMDEADHVRSKVIETLRKHPEYLPMKAFRNYWNLTRFSGRHPYGGGYEIHGPRVGAGVRWMACYERLVYLDFRQSDRLRNWDFRIRPPLFYHISGVWLGLPFLLVYMLNRVRRPERGEEIPEDSESENAPAARRGTLTFMYLTTLFVLAMCMFVDGNEGNRIRFCIEPFVFIFAAMFLCAAQSARRRLRSR